MNQYNMLLSIHVYGKIDKFREPNEWRMRTTWNLVGKSQSRHITYHFSSFIIDILLSFLSSCSNYQGNRKEGTWNFHYLLRFLEEKIVDMTVGVLHH